MEDNGLLQAFYGDNWKEKVEIRERIYKETGVRVTISRDAKDFTYESVLAEMNRMKSRLKEWSDSGHDPIVGERLGLKEIFKEE
jgi:hypothetical protein